MVCLAGRQSVCSAIATVSPIPAVSSVADVISSFPQCDTSSLKTGPCSPYHWSTAVDFISLTYIPYPSGLLLGILRWHFPALDHYENTCHFIHGMTHECIRLIGRSLCCFVSFSLCPASSNRHFTTILR